MSKLDEFFKNGGILVTPTEELYNMLMEECERRNVEWRGGENIYCEKYNQYKEKTAVRLYGEVLSYCEIYFYIEHRYSNIIGELTLEDFDI